MPGRTAADRERCAVGLGRGCGASPGQPGECGRAPPAAFPQGSDGESCRSPSLPPSLSPCFSPCPLSPSLSLLPACLSPPSPSSGPKLSQPQLFTSCSAGVPAIKSKPLWNASHWSAHARRIHVAYAPSSRASSSTKLTELCCVPGTVLDAGGSQQ